MSDIYIQLRQRLDDMSIGYPETESGIEIKILKRLFTEKEAELFLHLTPKLENPKKIAQRAGLDLKITAERLEEMAKKGLIFRKRKDDSVSYGAVPFVIGIFEFQLKMDKELARDIEEYYQQGFGDVIQKYKTPLMRTVPVNRELVVKWPIAPYEDVLQIIDAQKKIAVVNCVCRTVGRHIENGCESPLEACFMFGSHSDFYVENGMGRYVDKEEAKEIIRKNLEQAPLVMQPTNTQRAGGMCMCCGDCCGMLRSLKLQPNPAESVQSNYFAKIDKENCQGCELCAERCQMDAITISDGIAEIDYNRCIGCGLCVPTCPADAVELIKKNEDKIYTPPSKMMKTYMAVSTKRGKLENLAKLMMKAG